jgi:choline dehydrogenase-like flavoprotein
MMEPAGGCAFVDETVRDGKRQSIFRSYVHPLMDQPNITVLTGAWTTRILFHRRRATGVEFHYQGKIVRAEATHEVILSLGTIHTPKLLMQSGIGDKAELTEIIPGYLRRAELERLFRDGIGTFWHQCGTAKRGTDAMSVVDGELKVYGVESLCIADASILPRVTTGNTMAPCVVIGEQAAALLQREINQSDSRTLPRPA